MYIKEKQATQLLPPGWNSIRGNTQHNKKLKRTMSRLPKHSAAKKLGTGGHLSDRGRANKIKCRQCRWTGPPWNLGIPSVAGDSRRRNSSRQRGCWRRVAESNGTVRSIPESFCVWRRRPWRRSIRRACTRMRQKCDEIQMSCCWDGGLHVTQK